MLTAKGKYGLKAMMHLAVQPPGELAESGPEILEQLDMQVTA